MAMKINVSSLLCYNLFFLVKSNEQLIDNQMKQFDLSRTQWKTLIRFNFLQTPCTQQQLLKSMEIDPAHLTRIMDQLEQRKLLTRTRLPNDKRGFNISLTSQGNKLLKKMEKIMEDDSDALIEELNENELKIFNGFLNKITSSVLRKIDEAGA